MSGAHVPLVTTTPEATVHCLYARATGFSRHGAEVRCSAQLAAFFLWRHPWGSPVFVHILISSWSWNFDGACPFVFMEHLQAHLQSSSLPLLHFFHTDDILAWWETIVCLGCWLVQFCWDLLCYVYLPFFFFVCLHHGFDSLQSFGELIFKHRPMTRVMSTTFKMFFFSLFHILNFLGHINTHRSNWNILIYLY